MSTEFTKNVLVLFAHPAFQRSRVNRALVSAARGVEGITFHDLYESYPDLVIDSGAEQRTAEGHDIIVFQHPFFWYSAPAMVKEWLDVVLEYGWAYGEEGNALQGKLWLTATTTGGTAESYCCSGKNQFTMRELLAPFQQTAALCGMTYLPPFVVHGTFGLDDEALVKAADEYAETLRSLRDGAIDPAAVGDLPSINGVVNAVAP